MVMLVNLSSTLVPNYITYWTLEMSLVKDILSILKQKKKLN